MKAILLITVMCQAIVLGNLRKTKFLKTRVLKTLDEIKTHPVYKSHFKKHLDKFNKDYNATETVERFNNFLKTHNQIEKHNVNKTNVY